MFGFGYSAEHHVLAVVSCNPLHSDEHYEALLQWVGRLDGDGAWRGRAVGLLFLSDSQTQPPTAHWRRRFAEQRWTWRSPRVFNSVVSHSALQRGIITALNWVKPEPPHMLTALHATAAEAEAWLAAQQGTPVDLIRQLVRAAQETSLLGR